MTDFTKLFFGQALTLHGLKAELSLQGITVSHNTIWEFIRSEGLHFKKNAVRP